MEPIQQKALFLYASIKSGISSALSINSKVTILRYTKSIL